MPYDANAAIILSRTNVKLVDGPSCPVQVVLRLSPVPRIHFELLDPSSKFQWALLEAFTKDDPVVIQLPSSRKLQVLVAKQSLIPASEPVTALDTEKPFHAVRFGVINFPNFTKQRTTGSPSSGAQPWSIENLRTMRLKGGPWLIEIKPADNFEQVHEGLGQQRGFALTHWGKITRIDGNPFHKQCVQPFLATLNRFLSFVRGVSCGVTLIRGLDEGGETVWEEWGITKVQPWKGHKSCLDVLNGTALEDLFEGFWTYSQTLTQDSQPLLALEWYLESNAQEALHTSIVLTHAALERLTFESVGPRAGDVPSTKSRKEKEGDWMARALCKTKADLAIPQALKEELGDAKHGPHALVAIRNDLAHPQMKKGVLSPHAYRDARALGLWYTELLLLELFGYNGLYSNRLTRKWTGDVETVPWARPA